MPRSSRRRSVIVVVVRVRGRVIVLVLVTPAAALAARPFLLRAATVRLVIVVRGDFAGSSGPRGLGSAQSLRGGEIDRGMVGLDDAIRAFEGEDHLHTERSSAGVFSGDGAP